MVAPHTLLSGLALVTLLLSQSACVGAVMSAANAQEVEDRRAIKRWIFDQLAYKECEVQKIAPEVALLYYDFNKDGHEELVVTAATCMTGTAGPDIHTVLKRENDGRFTEWPHEEVSQKRTEPAHFEGNRNYRLNIENDRLTARWKDRSGRTNDAMIVTYGLEEDRFTIDEIRYPQ